jgi:hypothetical protein
MGSVSKKCPLSLLFGAKNQRVKGPAQMEIAGRQKLEVPARKPFEERTSNPIISFPTDRKCDDRYIFSGNGSRRMIASDS